MINVLSGLIERGVGGNTPADFIEGGMGREKMSHKHPGFIDH